MVSSFKMLEKKISNLKLILGLRIITTLLGGGVTNDGIDKVDNGGGTPMQVSLFLILIFCILNFLLIFF